MKTVFFDCETTLIRPGCQFPDPVVVCANDQLYHWSDDADAIEAIFADPSSLYVGHNVAFDMGVLARAYPRIASAIMRAYEESRVTCTMLRQRLIDIALTGLHKSYSLDTLAQRLLSRVLDKDTWRLRYADLRAIPLSTWPLGAKEYVRADVRATADVYTTQAEYAYLLANEYAQARAQYALKCLSAEGVRTDSEAVDTYEAETRTEYQALREHLTERGLIREDRRVLRRTGHHEWVTGSRNVGAVARVVEDVYVRSGRSVPRTSSGRVCTDKLTCDESNDPTLKAYGRYSHLGTVLAKEIPLLRSGCDEPIHAWYETIVASGRTSCQRPNLQNLPRKGAARSCFVPHCLTCGSPFPGLSDTVRCVCGAERTVFIAADHSGLELCTLAETCYHLFGRSTLGDAINEGRDPHLELAARILGRSYADCLAEKKTDTVNDARQTAKVANFGFPGGLGIARFVDFALSSYGVRLTEGQARQLKDFWRASWPEMPRFFEYVNEQVETRGFIEQIYSQRFRGEIGFTDGCNTLFQGLGADAAKEGLWHVLCAGLKPVLFVHDEIVIVAPESETHTQAQRLCDAMVAGAKRWLPHMSVRVEVAAMRFYSKEAKTIYNDEGELQVWPY